MAYNCKTLKVILFLVLITASGRLLAQIPNAGFENWTTSPFPVYDIPTGWGTVNSSTAIIGVYTVTKETTPANVHSGNSSIKLSTHYISFANETAPGTAATGVINTNNRSIDGGYPFTNRPHKFTGWFKYSPANTDTCGMEVTLYKRNGATRIKVADASFQTKNTVSTYTKFVANLNYLTSDVPDSALIVLLSSGPDAPQDGSVLYIDDLKFVSCDTFTSTTNSTATTTVGGTNGTATVATTGGEASYTYNWNNGGSTATITAAAGNYTVTVTDGNGCSTSASANIAEHSCAGFAGNVTATAVTTGGGSDGTATANIVGGTTGYTYQWSNSGNTQTISGLTGGNYCVTVTDAANCSLTGCAIVSSPSCAGFSVSLSGTNVTTVGGTNGAVDATITGGTAGFSYAWSNNTTTEDLTGVPADNYCVTVTDNAACIASACLTVSQPSCAGFGVTLTATDVTTINGTNGTVTTSVTGGAASYSYLWSNAATTADLSSLAPGPYCVTVTDAVNCTVASCDSVSVPSCNNLAVTLVPTDATGASVNDGSVTTAVTGGNSNFSYLWSNSSTSANLNGVVPGNYCVTVTDQVNCTVTACQAVSFTSGINNTMFSTVKVYPNPAKDVLTIEANSVSNFEFALYTIDGKLLMSRNITDAISAINLTSFETGFYLYKMRSTQSSAVGYGKLEIKK